MAQSQGHTVVTVSAVFGVMTIAVMSLRMFARIYVLHRVGLDDVLICIAGLFAWGFIVATIIAVNHGLGEHQDEVLKKGVANLNIYAESVWFSSIFYNACLGFVKTSVLALYLRLGDPTLKRLAQVMIVAVTCQAIANVLTCIFECSPIAAAYNTTLQDDARCINTNAFYLANAALNILTDLLTYCLPIRLVMKLQIPRSQKIGLGVMLSLGLFACLSSIIRITYIPKMLWAEDQTWAITGAMYWSVIETNVGILAASIPSFKVIAKQFMPRLLGSSYESNHYPSRSVHRKVGSSGFHKMGASSIKDQVALDGLSKAHVQTTINQDTDSISSCEEALHPPDRIGVTTHVQVEGSSSQSLYDDGTSLGSHKGQDLTIS